jgi:hypothetical protein
MLRLDATGVAAVPHKNSGTMLVLAFVSAGSETRPGG